MGLNELFARVTLAFGKRIIAGIPAADANAANEAEVSPVEAHMTAPDVSRLSDDLFNH